MIKDLFSHKIHSSSDDWPDKIVEIASVFKEFHGEVYDRTAIEKRLLSISPRAACVPRDASKFRDEISAYPAYLGLYNLYASPKGWKIKLTHAAQEYLLKEEPDVGSFIRLQMVLFQYPNGMGAAYSMGTNKVRVQANARDRMLWFIKNGIHLSPFRLIVNGLLADAYLRDINELKGLLTFEEVYVLANDSRTNRATSPSTASIQSVLSDFREGKILCPNKIERRFHILKHTDLFKIGKGTIEFREPINQVDETDLLKKVTTISDIKSQFDGFDNCTSSNELINVIKSGSWSNYFDGLTNLNAEIVRSLAKDIINELPEQYKAKAQDLEIQRSPSKYALTDRREYSVQIVKSDRGKELADPEVTKIKRQKRNLEHKLLVDKMCTCLSNIGAIPQDNPHIDLYAEIPNDGAFLFEMKSGGENYLEQIRKGISQLYEYKYRYRESIKKDTNLCLVLPNAPSQIPWITQYLCIDRNICLCWFDNECNLCYPEECKDSMIRILVNR